MRCRILRDSGFSGALPVEAEGLAVAEALKVLRDDGLEALHVGVVRAGEGDAELVGGSNKGTAAKRKVDGGMFRRELDRKLVAPVLGKLLEITAATGCGDRGMRFLHAHDVRW